MTPEDVGGPCAACEHQVVLLERKVAELETALKTAVEHIQAQGATILRLVHEAGT